jgi:protein-tyrosine phosphatase
VRDLGGLRTGSGKTTALRVVVRADNARLLTAAGWQAAEEYGIAAVLDLRSEPESLGDPSPHPAFAHTRVSLFEDFDGDAAYRSELARRIAGCEPAEQYRLLYTEALQRNAARFGDALGVISRALPGGTLVHCAAGKDRTGVLAALLLRLVEVPIDAVERDYVHSEKRLGVEGGTPAGVIGPVLEQLEAEHGGVRRYFLHAGASAVDLDRVARSLLGKT